MALYALTDYLFVCEEYFGGGCGRELLLEKQRGIKAAIAAAEAAGWRAYGDPWSDNYDVTAACPECYASFQARREAAAAKSAAAG